MIRKSPIAGSWYEGKPNKLKQQIEKMFNNKEYGFGGIPNTDTSIDNQCIGVISPHAGYAYSGPVATHAYAEIKKNYSELDTVIVIGPNHRGIGSGISFYPEGEWEFPLGILQVDDDIIEFAKKYDFGDISNEITFDRMSHEAEHSIDIQFPILQYLYGNSFKILPICIANQSLDPMSIELSSFLKDTLSRFKDKKIVIIASTDLSHEHDYDKLMKNDQQMIEFINSAELEKAETFRYNTPMTMCGYGSVYTLINLAKQLGKPKVNILKYANSGQVTGSKTGYTVGYLAAGVYVE